MASLKDIARECAENLKNKNVFVVIKKYEKSWARMFYTTDTNAHVVGIGIQTPSPDHEQEIKECSFIAAYDDLVLRANAVALDYETIYKAEGKVTIAACEKAIREAYENKGEHTAQDFKYFRNLTDEEKAILKKHGIAFEDEQEEETTLDVETDKKTITGASSISKTDYVSDDENAKNHFLRLNIEDALQTRRITSDMLRIINTHTNPGFCSHCRYALQVVAYILERGGIISGKPGAYKINKDEPHEACAEFPENGFLRRVLYDMLKKYPRCFFISRSFWVEYVQILNVNRLVKSLTEITYFKATEIAKNLKVKYKTLTKLFYTQFADLADLSNREIPIISKRETTEFFLTDSQALFLVLCLPNMPQIAAIKKEIARQVSQRAPPKIKLKS